MRALRDRGILAKRYFFPGVHCQRPFRDCGRAPLPATDALNREVLVLPTGTVVTDADVSRVAAALRDVRERRADYADARPLAPRDFDTSNYASALKNIDAEREALRARLGELDRAEAALRTDLGSALEKTLATP